MKKEKAQRLLKLFYALGPIIKEVKAATSGYSKDDRLFDCIGEDGFHLCGDLIGDTNFLLIDHMDCSPDIGDFLIDGLKEETKLDGIIIRGGPCFYDFKPLTRSCTRILKLVGWLDGYKASYTNPDFYWERKKKS